MNKSRKYRFKWGRLILLVFVGYFLYLIVAQQSQLGAIERETKVTQQRLEQAAEQKAALTEERNKLNDPAHIEKLAREELGLTKPGEIPYIPKEKNN